MLPIDTRMTSVLPVAWPLPYRWTKKGHWDMNLPFSHHPGQDAYPHHHGRGPIPEVTLDGNDENQ